MNIGRIFLRALVLAAVAAGLAGCSTVSSRIREKQAVFDALPAADQERVRQGSIAVGDTMDMVYMALGRPDERRQRRDRNGERVTWIYNTYYQEYAGRDYVGYRRYVVYDEKTQRHLVFREPVYRDVYRHRREERIRVVFDGGRVALIDQRKD